jgi:hypothetical protein
VAYEDEFGKQHRRTFSNEGLSIRDYFAAKAMQMKFGTAGSSIPMEQMAADCYAMADAMLAERNKS